jgi:hypothetical protein
VLALLNVLLPVAWVRCPSSELESISLSFPEADFWPETNSGCRSSGQSIRSSRKIAVHSKPGRERPREMLRGVVALLLVCDAEYSEDSSAG